MSDNLNPDVEALLRDRGWSVLERNPQGSDLWALQDRAEMYLPRIIRRGSFEWSDVTRRIATAQNEAIQAIERALEFVRFDITRFRVDDDSAGGRTVSLEAGATIISSAFGMMRAAATTSRRPRQSIGNNYSKLGDDIARKARLAHTEVGSFVFPVLLRVSDAGQDAHTPLPDDALASVRPESEERRVTRTLAQAMAAFEKHVIRPAREPQLRDLTPVVIAGGSKEMFVQLSRALAEPNVSWIQTGFEWAATEHTAVDAPRSITIPGGDEARELLAASIRLLSSPDREPLRVVTGPIIYISHSPGDAFGEIAIQSASRITSRIGRVEARVRADQLTEIHQWMDQSTTVVVHGTVEHRPGRPARLREIASPQPLQDTIPGFDA